MNNRARDARHIENNLHNTLMQCERWRKANRDDLNGVPERNLHVDVELQI